MRDCAAVISKPAIPPSSLLPIQHPATVQGATFDVSPADEERGLDYPKIEDVMTRSLQQRSNSIDQVLQDCGNNLSVPMQDYNRPQTRDETDEDGQYSTTVHPAEPEPISNSKDMPECKECVESEENGLYSVSQTEESVPPPKRDVTSSDHRGESKYIVPDCTVTITEHTGSSPPSVRTGSHLQSDNSYAKSSEEVGTAELSSSHHSHATQGTDTQMQFNLSLEPRSTSPSSDKQSKQDGTDEGYSGFFGSMKKLLTSPKKRPADIVIPYEISSLQNSKDPSEAPQQGHSDPRGSENTREAEASNSWPGSQLVQNAKLSASPQAPPSITLPSPQEFGSGNPFLMFVCLTLLLQHRDQIIRSNMDYEDVAMLFDKMVRRHDVHKVLHQARELYSDYLRTQQALADQRASKDGLSV